MGDAIYYVIVLGVALFSLIVGLSATGRLGQTSGWLLLALWGACAATAITWKVRFAPRERGSAQTQ